MINIDTQLNAALAAYGLADARRALIRHNENATYRIDASGGTYVLRLHIPNTGFDLRLFGAKNHSRSKIEGEMRLVLALGDAGFNVQRPVANARGELVTEIEGGACATLLTWLDGECVSAVDADIARDVGVLAAKLRAFSIARPGLNELDRYAYDENMICALRAMFLEGGDAGAFGDGMSDISRALDAIAGRVAILKNTPGEYGIIHADLSKGNIIISGGNLSPIDFCLSGRGLFRHELGQLLADFGGHRRELFAGYSAYAGEPVNERDADMFLAMSVMLFLGAQWRRYYKEAWFAPAVLRWRRDLFRPAALEI